MCGIVGYLGEKQALPILLDGLRRLEYRGYDSAGIAVLSNGSLAVKKNVGKVADLIAALDQTQYRGTIGIGHTRWATHGVPNETNAHPHFDCHLKIALIHNGVIENFHTLKTMLESKGHHFRSETDTEVLAHLIEEIYNSTKDFELSIRMALKQVVGTYGLVVTTIDYPDTLFVARKGSPLVIGYGDGEMYIASDPSAMVAHTRKVVYLQDGEVATITRTSCTIKTLDDEYKHREIEELTFSVEQIEKCGYPHFMLKEIHEQPQTIQDSMRGRVLLEEGSVKLGGLDGVLKQLLDAQRIVLVACGTSWHAALVGEYMLEQYVRIPVEVDYASEFRYRDPVLQKGDVVIVISQSGETADTLAALREAKARGVLVLGICNVVGSTIARESDGGVYIHAGPEIGVASTKAFTSQLTVLALLTVLLGRKRGILSKQEASNILHELSLIPEKVQSILSDTKQIEKIAQEFYNARNFLYLGRGYNFPVALEGALKLKEISYIHAEGYPAAEMKHGPIALIDNDMPVVFIAPRDATYEKVLSNIQEVRARNGRVIAIVNDSEEEIQRLAEYTIHVPHSIDMLSPLLTVIPLQLLAYYIAVLRGCNVDQPRNLAKSVTVE
ncbi:MAG: glutamine--fructose-6-phosphate transaminase (isomerizing) [Bacteroidetes bacterium]|nr:glutamine--fructose-6-phosphate transaminase (isomerizing) [Bacteroidota bacterium]